MPTYMLQHLTRYNYEDPVSVCHHLAHLLPRDTPNHHWHTAEVDINPLPAVRAERLDYFGNRLTFFAIQEPHSELSVFSHARVDLTPTPPAPTLFASPPWEQVRDQMGDFRARLPSHALLSAAQFIVQSPYVQWNGDISAFAAVSFTPGRPIVEAALDLVARIHREFAYDVTSTTVSTTVAEVIASKAGVCQDFAHLLIASLRSMGLPARYVSGYLLTTPPPGKSKLVGADASHAWASLFVPGLDQFQQQLQFSNSQPRDSSPQPAPSGPWLDLDPTNNLIPSDKHITLAWGRDFGDVSPIRGIILGGGRHSIQVNVDVAPG